MSKEEMKEIGEYKRWRLNLIVFAAVCGAYFMLFLCIFISFAVTEGFEIASRLLGLCVLPLIIFMPFILYYGVQMISLRKHAADYTKIRVSIIHAESDYFGHKEGGVYDCSAHYAETNITVNFTIYMRYVPNGIDLDNGKLVDVWYNSKTEDALFANKVKDI